MQKIENGFKQIIKIQYGFIDDLISTIQNPDKTITVVFNTGTWIDFYTKLFSIEFSETSDNTANGIIYNQKLNLELQGDAKEVNSDYYKLVNKELIFRLIYEDGTSKILGEINNPCFLFKDFISKPLDSVHKFYLIREDYRPALFLNN